MKRLAAGLAVFIMAAVLEWANIAHNLRGYIELTQEYKNKIYFR